MPRPEVVGEFQEHIVAPSGDIFLDPSLHVPQELLERLSVAEEERASSLAARQELSELYGANSASRLREVVQRMVSDTMTAEDRDLLVSQNVLEDGAGGYGDLVASVTQTSDRLAAQLTTLLRPGEYAIGDSLYSLGRGAWFRVWFSRMELDELHVGNQPGRLAVFNRYDGSLDPSMRTATVDERIQLIHDVYKERQAAGAPDELPPEPKKRISLLQPKDSQVEEFPYVSNEIGIFSQAFYGTIQEFIPNGEGVIAQNRLYRGQVRPVDTGTGSVVTVALDVKKHIERQALRIDDKGNEFEGPGYFTWQVTTSSGEGKTIEGITVSGSQVKAAPTIHLDRAGRIIGVETPNRRQIGSIWHKITKLVTSDLTQQKIMRFQENRDRPPTVPLQLRQRRVLEILGRMDLFEQSMRRPSSAHKGAAKPSQSGFKGTLVDVEALLKTQLRTAETPTERFEQLTLDYTTKPHDLEVTYRIEDGRVVEVPVI